MNLNALFSIGETAKIHHISKQTLIFYDKIGLLKPCYVNPETGYRYYSLDDFAELDVIIYLKDLSVPLEDIKRYLQFRDPQKSEEFLQKQRDDVNKQLEKLKAIRTKIDSSLSVYEDYKDWADKKGPFIKKRKEQHEIRFPVAAPYGALQESMSMKELVLFVERKKDYLTDYTMGNIVSKENLLQHKFVSCQTFATINQAVRSKYYHKQPAGDYATIYHHGFYEDLKYSYQELLDFIAANKYELDGDAREYYILDIYVVQDEKNFVTELSIKVKT